MTENLGNMAYLLKCLMDNTTDMIYFKDLDSRFLMVNEACAKWHGHCDPSELVGKSDFDNYTAADARRMRDDEKHIMEGGEPLVGIEEHMTWADRPDAWVSTSKIPLRKEGGDVIGIAGTSRDITEYKATALREARYAAEVKRYAEKMKRINAEMQDDLHMAEKLQKTFFPTSYPVFPEGALPADRLVSFHHYQHSGGLIGGDLCSIHKLSEAKVGIFLCDVMGHGIRAALGTAIIRTMLDDLFSTEHDPGRCLARMNEALIPLLRSEGEMVFATACYLVLNLATGCLQMANAGHPLPVCLSASGQVNWCVDNHSECGPALAIIDQATYPTIQREINPGGGVVMFTDGIFEISRSDEDEYGEQRLLESFQRHRNLPLAELFPMILKEARQFAGEKAFDDDVCLVGFQLRQPRCDDLAKEKAGGWQI
jgi:sigma-B regulation protein RsbU (phosphoserine phosphatase)